MVKKTEDRDVNYLFVVDDARAQNDFILATIRSLFELGNTIHTGTRLSPLLHGGRLVSFECFCDTLALKYGTVHEGFEDDRVGRILEIDALQTAETILVRGRLDDPMHGRPIVATREVLSEIATIDDLNRSMSRWRDDRKGQW